jgi:phosphinothricin acetyltransferase
MYAGVTLPNDASIALHRRFRPIATYSEVGRKFGRHHDVAWFERAG